MGRQTEAVLDDEAEQEFISFLRATGDIEIFRSFAIAPEDLRLNDFAIKGRGEWIYYIWNKNFDWVPEYKQTRDDLEDKSRCGLYYVSNKGDAPLIEYSRHNFDDENIGRIYWSKYFSAPKGLGYDVEAFECWYESVVKKVRKLSKRVKQARKSVTSEP
jgi:hypothetical protein